ncbi:metallophosphoesterase family protein [Corynebacterium aquatimens]|uniref:3',5'-cyclic AMP phosphodiesterase CpdA n=1 Tax=Corynebacterium aquatimens TaxID=1190508 RepID=A0A931GSA1_9CORY|nr:metallophosphoesterase [Corynebacterium aquatimens]MBG6121842.1 3',5'-cyclic AMP phosphodiesterase CpdA [Corynebacterium aquatimens]WJY65620.1 Calcineurin-like phosphoesterase [Corynebacterium aquatimens]
MTTLWAVSDLHAAVKANRARIEEIVPESPDDWLIVAGDVGERTELIVRVMAILADRFHTVIWVPGNHELYSRSGDRHTGRDKYAELVAAMRSLGVITPEDEYPVFGGVTIVPLFTLYDYSFRLSDVTVQDALAQAEKKNIVFTDEVAIAPFVDMRAWCWDRLAYSTKRLSRINGPTILINHWPLIQEPTEKMMFPEMALWCGTRHTRSWAQRYNATHVIYGHLHIPGVMEVDGTKHIEVSLGYPAEWQARKPGPLSPPWPYPVMSLPRADADPVGTVQSEEVAQ